MSEVTEVSKHVRHLNITDLPAVAAIHSAAFPDSSLTKLGREAVRRYYEWQIVGPHDGVNIGAFTDDVMLGFCFGGIRRGALGGFLEKNRRFLIIRVATRPWLLFNPLFRERAQFAIQRLFGKLRPSRPPLVASSLPVVPQPVPAFGILSIAVDPRYQGSGAAQLLMEYSEQEALRHGFSRMHLTVHPSNTRAVRFYEKMGWQREPNTSESWSGNMIKPLHSAEKNAQSSN